MSSASSRRSSDQPFRAALFGVAGIYLLLVAALLAADGIYAFSRVSLEDAFTFLRQPDILASVRLTFFTCTVSTALALLVAIPGGYALSRISFPGKSLVDALIDVPLVLPPLVLGLSLLILFNEIPPGDGASLDDLLGGRITYGVPAVVLAQFVVGGAYATRTMRNTFDQIRPRAEDVARTLGCGQAGAFFRIAVPSAWRGISTAGTLAWARALGEFGPILVFAGAIRGKTEVLSTTVFLEISSGNLEGAVVVALAMVTIAVLVLFLVRVWEADSRSRSYDD